MIYLNNVQPLLDIAPGEYWYLATPYSKYPKGTSVAFGHACEVAGLLVAKGVKLYCPIAHTHPIAEFGNLDPRDHKNLVAAR